MMNALGQCFRAEVRVNVMHQGSGRLLPDEASLLGTRKNHAQVREVALQLGALGGAESVVAARTVYVSRKLRQHRELSALGSRPLGELLFASGKPRWLERQFAAIRANNDLFALIHRAHSKTHGVCWARRSLFLFERQRLLVTEIFLPAMFRQRPVVKSTRYLYHGHQPKGADE